MAMWLCRAGRYGEYENRFLEDGRIYCTWDNLDLSISSFSKKQDLQQYFIDHFQDVKTKTAMNWASQVYPFGHEMKKGEIVVLPSKIKAVIHFGKITGDYVFDETATPPFCHYHTVDWYAVDIPRSAFDQDILYSFGAFMTICRIKQEDRIKAQIKASQHGSTQVAATQPPIDTTSRDIEQDALGDITDLIIQKAKGHGLAQIVDAKKVVYPHSFRHRYAKNFLEKYNDIALLADLMGHESIETTRIYLRRTASEQQALVDKIVTW